MLMVKLILNAISSWIYCLFGSVTLQDWKHYPNYEITLDDAIPTSGLISAYDVQPTIIISQYDERGAILGYDAGGGTIDATDFVGHVTPEGTIIVWGADADPGGIPCVIFPYNTEINHITADGYDVEVLPIPYQSSLFQGILKWRYTDRPNYWFCDDPRISITVKYDTSADKVPYVDTTYWMENVSRYDHKNYMPIYYHYGTEMTTYQGSIKLTKHEYRSQIDLCAWLIGILKRKYTQETAKLDNFRKSTFNE